MQREKERVYFASIDVCNSRVGGSERTGRLAGSDGENGGAHSSGKDRRIEGLSW